MLVTVAVFSGDVDQVFRVVNMINQAPDLRVVFSGVDIRELENANVVPDVVLVGVEYVAKGFESNRWWKSLSRIRGRLPETKFAVWFAGADPGTLVDLTRAGLHGLVKWFDSTPEMWPKMVRSIRAGATFWSRPFDDD